MFTKKDTATQVVKVYPQASDLFKEHDINFCCKGDQSIESQCADKSINVDLVIEELNKMYDEWKKTEERSATFNPLGLEQLTEEIFLKQSQLTDELSSLRPYVERVSLVHGAEQAHLKNLEELYFNLMDKLSLHFEDELIFISLIKNPRSKAELSLASIHEKLEKGKKEIEKTVSSIKKITNNFIPPKDACGTYRVTYSRLAQVDQGITDYMKLDKSLFTQTKTY